MTGTGHFRVLLICDTYPPVLGGSEIEAQRVASAMIRRGHKVHVLCSGGPPMPAVRDWVDPTGVPVTILTSRSRGRAKDWVFAAEVARFIWDHAGDYDVIYFLMQGLHLAAGLPLTRLLKKAVVMKIAGSSVIPLMRGSRAGRLELDWLQKWHVPVMLLNEGMIQEALADGFTRDQLVWMPNPVDVAEFRPAEPGEGAAWRATHGIDPDARVVTYVGRLAPEKGLLHLLPGFAIAARRDPRFLLLLVGDGVIRADLERAARELALSPDRVRFTGRVPATEIPAWLRASDAYTLTSPSEGFPCALLEAMSAGLPSVVSAIPANLQLVEDGVHGYTVPFDDPDAIGGAMERLLGDREQCRSMGAAARQRVLENYSTEKVIARYEALFAEVLRKS